MTTTMPVNFLTSGPRYVLDLPDGFQPVPTAMTALQWGNGARAVWGAPLSRLPHIDEKIYAERPEIAEESNGAARCWERVGGKPPSWILRWTFDDGFVDTHVRGDEGFEMVRVVARSIRVIKEPASATPILVLADPVHTAVRLGAEHQDVLEFVSDGDQPVGSIRMTRPFTQSGGTGAPATVYRDDAGYSTVAYVSPAGCLVEVTGDGRAAAAIAKAVGDSVEVR